MRIVDQRSYRCSAIIAPAPTAKGQWLAHCPEFDLWSQGDSAEHALTMIMEACAIAIVDDLNEGLNPRHRINADNYARFGRMLRDAKATNVQEMQAGATPLGEGEALIAQWDCPVECVEHADSLEVPLELLIAQQRPSMFA